MFMNIIPAIEELVLHRPPMLLVQALIAWDKNSAEVIVDTKDSYLFADAEGKIPAWVGIEYMAQTVSALSGMNALMNNEPLCLGFLLGTRRYQSTRENFSPSEILHVKVQELMRDENNLVLFDCHIYRNQELIASAEIKGIEPKYFQI